MGFPGNPKTRKIDGHTNNRESIAYYLETRHPHHFKLFNLTEEEYDPLLFENSVLISSPFHVQVANYNFTGYSSPSLGLLFRILLDIEAFLAASDDNVAVVHDFDGTGRAIMVSAAFIRWKGWLPSTDESLVMCLTRRGLPRESMLPSQLRFLDYFEAIMQGNRPSAEWLRLTRVTISSLPEVDDGAVAPIIEVCHRLWLHLRCLIGTELCLAAIEKVAKTAVLSILFMKMRQSCSNQIAWYRYEFRNSKNNREMCSFVVVT